jgi:hypothetical protein
MNDADGDWQSTPMKPLRASQGGQGQRCRTPKNHKTIANLSRNSPFEN